MPGRCSPEFSSLGGGFITAGNGVEDQPAQLAMICFAAPP
jgi:hypothetical protein